MFRLTLQNRHWEQCEQNKETAVKSQPWEFKSQNNVNAIMTYVFCMLCFVHFVVPTGISPMGNSGCFPQRKPAATESRYPTLN